MSFAYHYYLMSTAVREGRIKEFCMEDSSAPEQWENWIPTGEQLYQIWAAYQFAVVINAGE